MHIAFKIEKGWVAVEEPKQGAVMLNLHQNEEELLFSGTSMTLRLEQLLGSPVEVDQRFGSRVLLDPQAAGYLGVSENTEAQEREVWLTVNGQKLVYAHTLLPIGSIKESLLDTLKERSSEPIGRVLSSLDIPFPKKKLEIAILNSTEIALELGLKPDTRFVARRYILYNGTTDRTKDSPAFMAAITEIFNPEIVSCKMCES